jgi:hypothetical protein
MPRLATRGLNSGAGSRPREAIRKADHARVTRTVAPADTLTLAPGRWGWKMPHLDGAPAVHRVWRGDRVAAAIGSAMLRAGVADAHAWSVSNGDPFQFVQTSLAHFVETARRATRARGVPRELGANRHLERVRRR